MMQAEMKSARVLTTRATYSRSAQPQEQLNYQSCDLRCQQFYLKNKPILAADAGITEPIEVPD